MVTPVKAVVRVWQELEIADIEKHLIVVGELSAECYACRHIGLDPKSSVCPNCHVSFKYRGFRRKIDQGYIKRARQEFPALIFIDFDDFKRSVGKDEARKLLDI